MSRIIEFAELSLEPKQVVADAEALFKRCDAFRRQRETEWLTNIGFLAGDQWENYANVVERHRKVPIQANHSKAKLTSNRIYPLVRQALSSLMDNMPQEVAVAATNDPLDIAAAELSTDFLQDRFEADNEFETRMYELLWLMTCGTIMRRTYFDPDIDGRGPDGNLVPGLGDIKSVTLNPFRFHLFPWMDNPMELPGFIESDVRDIEWVNDTFKPEIAVQSEECSEFRELDALATGIISQGKNATSLVKREKAVVLKRVFVAPNAGNPEGRCIVTAGGQLLRVTDLPEGELCAQVSRWFPIPGRVYSMPCVTPLRDPQKELNITLSQLVELRNRQLRGDMVVQGNGDVTQEVDPETGAKRVYLPLNTIKWDFIRYDLNTGEANLLMAQFQEDMRDAAGVHNPTMGDAPAKAQTATAVSLLKDADMSGLTFFRNSYASSMCKVARTKLLIARNRYTVPRMLRSVGENNSVNTQAFFGSDLRNTEDVRPKSTPMVSETMKAQIRASLAQGGAYDLSGTPPAIVNKLMTLINSGLPDALSEVESLIAPLTIEDVKRKAAEYVAASLIAQVEQAKMMAQAASQPPQEETEPEKPPVPMLV